MKDRQKRIIKKYSNRRLYDTATSGYITLEDVKQLVLEKIEIQVLEAKTNEDITLAVLLQIVLEQESLGKPIFTYEVLTQLIRFYGNTMQSMIGSYLEQNLQVFTQMQQRLLEQGQTLYGKDFNKNKASWENFMASQAPMMQNILNQYLEQNANLFVNLQSQWPEQAVQVWKSFAFNPFMSATSASADQSATSATSKKKK